MANKRIYSSGCFLPNPYKLPVCGVFCIKQEDFYQQYPNNEQYDTQGFKEVEGIALCVDRTTSEDLTYGPFQEGESYENNFDYEWRFYVDPQSGEFFYNRIDQDPKSASEYFPTGTAFSNVSIGFDGAGRPILAVESMGRITLKRISVNNSVETYGPFIGISPQLFYNGLMYDYLDTGYLRDVVCYYLKRGDNKVYARFQRDNFSTEYVIMDNLPTEMSVLLMEQTILNKLYINIISSNFNSAYKLTSYDYPPYLRLSDAANLEMAFNQAKYVLVVIDAGEYIEPPAKFSSRFSNSYHIDASNPILDIAPYNELAIFNAQISEIAYYFVINDLGTYTEESIPSFSSKYNSIENFRVIIGDNEFNEISIPTFNMEYKQSLYYPVVLEPTEPYIEPSIPAFSGGFYDDGRYIQVVVIDSQNYEDFSTFNAAFSTIDYSGPVYITSYSVLPYTIAQEAYEFQFLAESGTLPYIWSLVDGTLPTGLTLNSDGLLNGTPTETGQFSFTVQVIDDDSNIDQITCSMVVYSSISDIESVIDTSSMVAVSSSIQGTNYLASYAFDRDLDTRWSSSYNDKPAWVYIDLENVRTITKIRIKWEYADATGFTVRGFSGDTAPNPYGTTLSDWDIIADCSDKIRISEPGGDGDPDSPYHTIIDLVTGTCSDDVQTYQINIIKPNIRYLLLHFNSIPNLNVSLFECEISATQYQN